MLQTPEDCECKECGSAGSSGVQELNYLQSTKQYVHPHTESIIKRKNIASMINFPVQVENKMVCRNKKHQSTLPREYIMSSFFIYPSPEVSDSGSEIDSSRTSLERGQTPSLENDFVHIHESGEKIIEEEQRMKGRVEISVYKKYAGFCGWFISVIICVSAIAMQATLNEMIYGYLTGLAWLILLEKWTLRYFTCVGYIVFSEGVNCIAAWNDAL